MGQYATARSLKMTEKFCLKWNDFQKNISSTFENLREDVDFTWVTLACEDGEQVEAHKVILAASSPFFQKLLKRNKHPHPLIYMRGVKSEDLVAIVDFLYHGEANVFQKNLDNFLAIADELSLKGLSGGKNYPKEQNDVPIKPDLRLAQKPTNTVPPTIKTKEEEKEAHQDLENSFETAVAHQSDFSVAAGDFHELNEQIKTMIQRSQNQIPNGPGKITMGHSCTVCGKEGRLSQIRDHIDANHIEGVSIPCSLCEKIFRSRTAVRSHNARNHTNLI